MATRRLPFHKLLRRGVREGATPFPGFLHFTLDPYLIISSVKPDGVKYHFSESQVWLDQGLNPISQHSTQWLIWGYFIPRGEGILFIVHSYLDELFSSFLRHTHTNTLKRHTHTHTHTSVGNHCSRLKLRNQKKKTFMNSRNPLQVVCGQFLIGEELVWIQSFRFRRLVA